MPKTAMMTLKLDPELHADFMAEAQAADRPASQLVRDMMRDYVKQQRDARSYEVWFHAQVEEALREADDPAAERISNDAVVAKLSERRDRLVGRLSQHEG
jgi:predicted transcriptional regulator